MTRRPLPLTRATDPQHSSDPVVRRLLTALAEVDYAPAPREEFRADLRRQLVAVTDRVVAEGDPAGRVHATTTDATAPVPVRPPARVGRRRAGRLHVSRPLTVAASLVVLLGLLLTGAVWLSQRAVPGDTLYGLKRTSEQLRLSLTSGDSARGREYLSLAQTRVDEARELAGSTSASGAGPQAAGMSAQTAASISSVLRSADSDLASGSSLLDEQAVATNSPAPLMTVSTWGVGQLSRLDGLRDAVPTDSLRAQVSAAWSLTDAAVTRARALRRHLGQSCLQTSGVDRLGPLPCSGSGSSAPSVRPGGTGRTRSATSTATPQRAGSSAARSATATTGPSSLPVGAPTSGLPTSDLPISGLPTSGLPTSRLPSAPVRVRTCGVSASLGPVGVTLGTCAPRH